MVTGPRLFRYFLLHNLLHSTAIQVHLGGFNWPLSSATVSSLPRGQSGRAGPWLELFCQAHIHAIGETAFDHHHPRLKADFKSMISRLHANERADIETQKRRCCQYARSDGLE